MLALLPRPAALCQAGIMGHSMGGHGALTIALKNPTAYKSVSAFAPICNPTQVPWGQKAFAGYLGEQWQEVAQQYDATELARQYSGPSLPVLMDTGTDDEFLKTQVGPVWKGTPGAGPLGLQTQHTSQLAAAGACWPHSWLALCTTPCSCTPGRLRRRRAGSCRWRAA